MSRIKKISTKIELQEKHKTLFFVGKYFKEYGLNEHFEAYLHAITQKKEFPKRLILQETKKTFIQKLKEWIKFR